ncbi:OmpA family protein [Microvirga puerhi]|uniref:OmpA family protein n=1 Tax=Microvirga puerhi TaxID=2876078 RepID=A0ABS7VN15_9HYPH|nr:OmpA family protein [Microvirga puerhi]MBZ6076910.1 OmpA family protein [Microvirga puerhi]
MKLTTLLLAGTALPLLAFPVAAAEQPQPPALTLAQASPGEMPPRVRPGDDKTDSGEAAPQRRGPPGRERGHGAAGEERPPQERGGPRPPRAAGPGDNAEPPAGRPAPPAIAPMPQPNRPAASEERPSAPERQPPQPGERTAPGAAPRQAGPQRQEERRPDQPQRPQAPAAERGAAPSPTPPAPTPPAEGQRRTAPTAEQPTPPATRAAPTAAPEQRPTARPSPTAPGQAIETSPAPRPATPPAAGTASPQRAPAPVPPQAPTAAPSPVPTQQGVRPQAPAPGQTAPSQPALQAPPPGAPIEARRPLNQDTQSFEAFQQGRIDQLRQQRRERTEEGGRRVIIEEPGDRTIIREGDRVIIRHDETDRFRRTYRDADIRQERRGAEDVTIIRRPDGSEIITVRDQNGNLLRRVRREPAGREVVLIDNQRGRQPGGYFVEDVVRLPPPVVRIPREQYIVDVEDASEDDLIEAFTAPPVDRIERAYTLDEIRQSEPLRERMRRVDLDTVTFDTGSWSLPEYQIGAMTGIAQAIQRALSRNPNEIFLVEGHTDAVGSDEDNLTLSDRRAETAATILTQRFNIPAENLTTQGYGEQYLKVNTQGPERQNRRVTIRRITPLLQGQNQAQR